MFVRKVWGNRSGSTSKGLYLLETIYVSLLIIWIIGRLTLMDTSLFVLGFNYFGVWLFSPLIILVPLVYVKKEKIGWFLLGIPILLFVWFYGELLLPKINTQPETIHTFKVMTFNLLESNRQLDSMINTLDANPVDMIAFQEVTSASLTALEGALGESYPHQATFTPVGLAVFSKFPLSGQRNHRISSGSFQSLSLEIGSDSIFLVNAHLAKPGLLEVFETGEMGKVRNLAIQRKEQIQQILQMISAQHLPAVVACDCNMTDLTGGYSQMSQTLRDAFPTSGWGFGHTFIIPRGFDFKSNINLPFQRIDYIFYSDSLDANAARVIRSDTGSDHRPVIAEFDISR